MHGLVLGLSCAMPQVSMALWLLRKLGQHKTARRLHYGHVAWQIQNTSKTDKVREHNTPLHARLQRGQPQL